MAKEPSSSRARKAAAKRASSKKTTRSKATSASASRKKASRKATAKKASRKATAKKASAKKTTPKKAAAKSPAKPSSQPTSKKAARKATKATRSKPTSAKKAAPDEEVAEAQPRPSRRASGPRGHPDAGLTQAQIRRLHARLLEERDAVVQEMRRSVQNAVDEVSPFAESIDRAQHETEQNFRLRLADKQRKLLNEIDAALQKMDTGEYGICQGTEEPIGFRRLEIRPWARYSVEYKELKDRRDR